MAFHQTIKMFYYSARFQASYINIAKLFKISLLLISLSLIPSTGYADSPIVAVASNLTTPISEIAEQFKADTGEIIRLSFGSSGNLSRQIVQGAPYDVFITASTQYIDFLIEQKITIKHKFEYIEGEIGFFVPSGSSFNQHETAESIIGAIKFGHQGRIAIANPEHAPYGIAAIEALQTAGIWAINLNTLLLAESVAQIVPYIHTGNLDLAIIPKSFVLQAKLDESGTYIPIKPLWHNRISQHIVILKDDNPVTFSFSDYLASNHAVSILEKYGYRYTGNK